MEEPRMSSPRTTLLIGLAAGFAAGAGAGYFVAGHSRAENRTAPAATKAGGGSAAASPELPHGDPAAGAAIEPRAGAAPISPAELRSVLAAMQNSGFGGMSSMRKIADLQDRLRVSDLPALAAEIAGSAGPQDRWMGLSLVLGAYAESDPQAAWALASGMKQGQTRQSAMSAVISAVASKDPTAALAMIDGIQDAQMKRQLRSMAVMNLAQKDPRQALELALKQGTGAREDDFSFSMIFSQWARKDIEGAKAAIARLGGRSAEQARSALLSSYAQTDPQGAWNYALTLPATGERHQDPRLQVIQTWSQSDPQAALQAAQAIAEAGARGMAVSSAVGAWARNDFGGALKYAVATEDAGVRGEILRTLSMNPTGNRKELLDAVLDHMPSGDNFQHAVSGIFSSWARENPAEAAAAVAELPPGRVFSNAVTQIASQWADTATSKKEVFDWARQLPEGEARQSALSAVISRWSGDNPQDALNALVALPPEDRTPAFQSLASGWGRKDPEAVLRWSATLADAGERAGIVRNAVTQWATSSPEAAAKYVARLPESERSTPMQAVVNQWASKDTQAAADWLQAQPQGAPKDAAIASLAHTISREDPQTALAWAATITDGPNRNRQVETLARDWIRQDAAAARAWISTSTLPEETRRRLLK